MNERLLIRVVPWLFIHGKRYDVPGRIRVQQCLHGPDFVVFTPFDAVQTEQLKSMSSKALRPASGASGPTSYLRMWWS